MSRIETRSVSIIGLLERQVDDAAQLAAFRARIATAETVERARAELLEPLVPVGETLLDLGA